MANGLGCLRDHMRNNQSQLLLGVSASMDTIMWISMHKSRTQPAHPWTPTGSLRSQASTASARTAPPRRTPPPHHLKKKTYPLAPETRGGRLIRSLRGSAA